MKRIGNLKQAIADPDNLRLAFWKARKGRNAARQVLLFRENLENNLENIRQQILDESLQVGHYHSFTIFDPKERIITASAFQEQVIHHAIMNVCDPIFERFQVYDSYACRRDKGVYAALKRAQKVSRSHAWFLKLDIRKYFDSISHEILNRQVGRIIKDDAVLTMLAQIIDSYKTSDGKGLPIGNLTSQYFANHYLAPLDHMIKENLRIKGYVRYMDDFVLWHQEKGALKDALREIDVFTREMLQLELKPIQLNRIAKGISFLGYRVFPYHIHLTHRSRQRFIRKIKVLENAWHSGSMPEEEIQRKALPLLAFVEHADSIGLRKQLRLSASG